MELNGIESQELDLTAANGLGGCMAPSSSMNRGVSARCGLESCAATALHCSVSLKLLRVKRSSSLAKASAKSAMPKFQRQVGQLGLS